MLGELLRGCCRPCSCLLIILHFPKSLSWPTYLVSRAISFPGTCGIDRGHLAESAMAVGTGFGQLFKSVGQVRSVTSVIEPLQTVTRSRSLVLPSHRQFSSRPSIRNSRKGSRGLGLLRYLSRIFHSFGDLPSLQIIKKIRESAKLVVSLPPDLQGPARDSYDAALRTVFAIAMCSTLMSFLVRLPVSIGRRRSVVRLHLMISRFRTNPWMSPPVPNLRNTPPRQTSKILPAPSPLPRMLV